MEIRINNVKHKKNDYYDLSSDKVYALYDNNIDYKKYTYQEKTDKSVDNNLEKVEVLEYTDQYENLGYTVEEYVDLVCKVKKIYFKNRIDRICTALKIVGLSDNCLKKNKNQLSISEKRLLQLALILLSGPKVILVEDILDDFDNINKINLIKLLKKIGKRYNKLIIFITNNSETIFECFDHILIIVKNQIIKEGKPSKVFQDVLTMQINNIVVPEIILFTYMVKEKKNIKLFYHDDTRDLMKDIYKHV